MTNKRLLIVTGCSRVPAGVLGPRELLLRDTQVTFDQISLFIVSVRVSRLIPEPIPISSRSRPNGHLINMHEPLI